MNIALLGYGTVGKSVEKLCENKKINISHILRRNVSQIISEKMTTNINEILDDKNVDCIVECMGGDFTAYSYVKSALQNGKHVVTSNKKMLANHYLELNKIANKNNKKLLFSSACGGGIPWIQELQNVIKSDIIYSFEGIMNGTSNYILDSMANNHSDFDAALKKAQELGFAENDPSDDIDGIDSANKTILSAGLAFSYQFSIVDMYIKGIRYINKDVFDYCLKNNLACILLSKGIRNSNSFTLYVVPCLVKKSSIIGNIHSSYNCFKIKTSNLEELSIIGQGAGGIPTASNILRDILSIDSNENVKLLGTNSIDYQTNKNSYYIYSNIPIDKEYIEETIKENTYLTKKINIMTLKKIVKDEEAFIAEVSDD